MTPRALLTVIGAAAIGFAIAIGTVAGFASGTPTPARATSRHQSVPTMTLADAGADRAGAGTTASMVRRTSQGDCLVAL